MGSVAGVWENAANVVKCGGLRGGNRHVEYA